MPPFALLHHGYLLCAGGESLRSEEGGGKPLLCKGLRSSLTATDSGMINAPVLATLSGLSLSVERTFRAAAVMLVAFCAARWRTRP